MRIENERINVCETCRNMELANNSFDHSSQRVRLKSTIQSRGVLNANSVSATSKPVTRSSARLQRAADGHAGSVISTTNRLAQQPLQPGVNMVLRSADRVSRYQSFKQ